VGNRKDHITGPDRAQIAQACWAAGQKRDGTRQRLAQEYQMTRQSVYNIVNKAKEVLPAALEPGRHGPAPWSQTVEVTRDHLIRSVLALYDSAVSERDMPACLEQILFVQPSLGWVSAQLAQLAAQATVVNAQWVPAIGEGLAGDEIYSQGQPNLLVVGNDSLYLYALTRQPQRDGDTWGCVLLDTPDTPHFSRDGGTGLHAGAELAEKPEQLDWWHTLRDLWRIDASRERRAYASLTALVEREDLFAQAHTAKRLAQHLAQWEKLNQQAEQAMVAYDAFHPLARQVDEQFAMFDVQTGQLRTLPETAARLRALGHQIHALGGRACTTLGATLMGQAETLCAYLPRLAQALAPVQTRWGAAAIAALCRIWQVEEWERRRQSGLLEQQTFNALWNDSLEEAAAELGENLFAAWDELVAILSINWRSSSAAECVNSLLRPHFNAHRYTDQKMLELLRFLHNVHRFPRGKRAGWAPAELVGLELPADPWTLLGLPPVPTPAVPNEPATMLVVQPVLTGVRPLVPVGVMTVAGKS
jgi:hypothetical protein